MSASAYSAGLARKRRLQDEKPEPTDLTPREVTELLRVISMEVAVGEFSLWDRQVLEWAADLLTSAPRH
jgi:hypothetical protein